MLHILVIEFEQGISFEHSQGQCFTRKEAGFANYFFNPFAQLVLRSVRGQMRLQQRQPDFVRFSLRGLEPVSGQSSQGDSFLFVNLAALQRVGNFPWIDEQRKMLAYERLQRNPAPGCAVQQVTK